MPAQRRNTAHEIFLQFHKHRPQSLRVLKEEEDGSDETKIPITLRPTEPFEMFHTVMKTGVIYATSRAVKRGFSMEDEEWANMVSSAYQMLCLFGL